MVYKRIADTGTPFVKKYRSLISKILISGISYKIKTKISPETGINGFSTSIDIIKKQVLIRIESGLSYLKQR